jgi:adenosylmethionine-8-amino-7-oxononanoate aminotransferase
MGDKGDAVIISPPYTVTAELIDDIVDRTARVIEDFFFELDTDSAGPEQ